jgi:hypothetical protein
VTPSEEQLYAAVGEEIVTKNVSRGLWTKAFAITLGDEAKTKAVYVELRVEQIRQQIIVANETEEMRRPHVDSAIRARLDALSSIPWEDTEQIPSNQFYGPINSLCYPISVERGSVLSGLLEFEIIDLIKRGHLKGLRNNTEWYFDLQEEA